MTTETKKPDAVTSINKGHEHETKVQHEPNLPNNKGHEHETKGKPETPALEHKEAQPEKKI